jgi:hypothetical protein
MRSLRNSGMAQLQLDPSLALLLQSGKSRIVLAGGEHRNLTQ